MVLTIFAYNYIYYIEKSFSILCFNTFVPLPNVPVYIYIYALVMDFTTLLTDIWIYVESYVPLMSSNEDETGLALLITSRESNSSSYIYIYIYIYMMAGHSLSRIPGKSCNYV